MKDHIVVLGGFCGIESTDGDSGFFERSVGAREEGEFLLVVTKVLPTAIIGENIPIATSVFFRGKNPLDGGKKGFPQIGFGCVDEDPNVGIECGSPNGFPLSEDGGFEVAPRPENEF